MIKIKIGSLNLYYIISKSSLKSLYSRTCFLIAELSTHVTKSSRGLKMNVINVIIPNFWLLNSIL